MNPPIAPGSGPYKTLAYLKRQPKGVEVSSRGLAYELGFNVMGVESRLRYAVRVGLLKKRLCRVGVHRYLVWSLGPAAKDWKPVEVVDRPAPVKHGGLMAAFYGSGV